MANIATAQDPEAQRVMAEAYAAAASMPLRSWFSCGQLTCASVMHSSCFAAWFSSSLESTERWGPVGYMTCFQVIL